MSGCGLHLICLLQLPGICAGLGHFDFNYYNLADIDLKLVVIYVEVNTEIQNKLCEVVILYL